MDMSQLPLLALKDIPKPRENAQQIVALQKQQGRVTGYQLSDGNILQKQQAVELARQGGIYGVGIASRNGTEYLKALPDANQNNNLGNLPTVSQ